MSNSKIGKWLTRDGRTAVVFAETDRHLLGAVFCLGSWGCFRWELSGERDSRGINGADLIRKVSDSTDLTPYVPTKRVRPWTEQEALQEILCSNGCMYVTDKANQEVVTLWHVGKYCVRTGSGRLLTLKELADRFNIASDEQRQRPCGVEVEE